MKKIIKETAIALLIFVPIVIIGYLWGIEADKIGW